VAYWQRKFKSMEGEYKSASKASRKNGVECKYSTSTVFGHFSLTRFFPWHFPDMFQIPWHFQVVQTSGHPG